MSGKFTIEDDLPEKAPDEKAPQSDPKQDVKSDAVDPSTRARASTKAAANPIEPASVLESTAAAGLGSASEAATIKLMAEQMSELGYHPVILFGSSNSGKTSMLLSLFAAVQTRVELQTAVHLNNNIVSANSTYGSYLRKSSQDFFQSKLTNFIEGRGAQLTKVDLPFFIPIDFTSSAGETVKIAFMEGNGEWFQPRRSDDGSITSANLNPAIELFIKNFGAGISFIHLLPYTQKGTGQADGYSVTEDLAKKDAGLAIKNVIDQYRDVREGQTSEDRHMLLVTKWDARFTPGNPNGDRLYDVLTETVDDVKYYLENNSNYKTAVVSFQGLSDIKVKNVRNYCAGRMSGLEVNWPHSDHDFYEPINRFPVELWKWIYSGAYGIENTNPFPKEKEPFIVIRVINDLLKKIIG